MRSFRTHLPCGPRRTDRSPARRRSSVPWLASCLALTFGLAAAEPRPASKDAICVTTGDMAAEPDGRYLIESSASRAVVRDGDDDYVGIVFEYLGPSKAESALASGDVRRQLGLKLQAQDSCNVIYVMWPVDGARELVVTSKVNRGQSAHAQCGVKGYQALTPLKSRPVAPIVVGQPRRLEASIDKRMLAVHVDGQLVWRGDAGPRTADLFGYPGLRTDNVRMRFAWLVEPDDEAPGRPKPRLHCRTVR